MGKMEKMESVDVYAYTNPAFVAVNINEFLKGYKEKKESCFYPVAYLVAPIVLSSKMNKYFEHTNKKTEFLNLIYRHPEVTLELPNMISKTKEYSNRAIIFGTQLGILKMDERGYLSTNLNTPVKNISDSISVYLKYSNRLGYWLGSLDESDIFFSLGVQL